MGPEAGTEPEAQELSTEHGEVSPTIYRRISSGYPKPKEWDHFLRSPCPLLVESSLERMAGSKTGFPTPPKPMAATQQSSE